jgi:hypothetical protein
MAEPINLDDLLTENIVDDTQPRDVTPESEKITDENISNEDEGISDNLENDSPDEENVITDENEGDGEEQVISDESYQETEQESVEEEQVVEDNYSEPEPAEYKFKDDFIKKAVEYYEMYGTLTPFLEATSIDYDSMSNVELLKLKFDKENSDLSEKAKARLFERELEKYNLDAYDEDEAEIGSVLLQRDANKLRASFKEEQSKFVQSIQTSPREEQAQQATNEEILAQQEESRKIIQKGVSGVVKNNLIKIEAGGDSLNYQIADTNKVVDYALDSNKFLSTFAKDGTVDWDKWTKVVAFAENPTQFIGELVKHGKSLGRKAMEAELKNATPNLSSKEEIRSNEFVSPYDNPVEFLKGMTVRK